MGLGSIREGGLKEVFDELEEAFEQLSIDFYLIGALARDIWYARGDKKFRTTKDVDFAIMISNKEDYEASFFNILIATVAISNFKLRVILLAKSLNST